MEIEFVKMHGTGNDFVVVDCVKKKYDLGDLGSLSKKLCDRHFGIGGDGLILVEKSEKADFRMRMFNPDGSEAEMCGNGIRCLAKYVKDSKLADKGKLTLETLAGLKEIEVLEDWVKVDMGEPELLGERELSLEKHGNFKMTIVSMGNPHAVLFVGSLDAFPVGDLGPRIEKHNLFPKRTNVEFVQVVDRTHLRVVVWERGAGLTLACGTGACASLVASVTNDKTDRSVEVHLPGGTLKVEWDEKDNHVYMAGPAAEVFKGKIEV